VKDNETLIRRWFDEVWNEGRVDTIDELFSEDGIAHGLSDDTGNPLRGPSGFKEFHTKFREAFPDIVVTVEDTRQRGRQNRRALFGARQTHGPQPRICCHARFPWKSLE